MSYRNFGRLESFQWLFRPIRNWYQAALAPLIGLVESSRTCNGRTFMIIRRVQGMLTRRLVSLNSEYHILMFKLMLTPFSPSKKVNLGALSRIVSSEPSISSIFAAPKLKTFFYYANCTPTYLLHSTAFIEFILFFGRILKTEVKLVNSSDTRVVKGYINRAGIMVPFINSLVVIHAVGPVQFAQEKNQECKGRGRELPVRIFRIMSSAYTEPY